MPANTHWQFLQPALVLGGRFINDDSDAFKKGSFSFASNPIPEELAAFITGYSISLLDFKNSAPALSGDDVKVVFVVWLNQHRRRRSINHSSNHRHLRMPVPPEHHQLLLRHLRVINSVLSRPVDACACGCCSAVRHQWWRTRNGTGYLPSKVYRAATVSTSHDLFLLLVLSWFSFVWY